MRGQFVRNADTRIAGENNRRGQRPRAFARPLSIQRLPLSTYGIDFSEPLVDAVSQDLQAASEFSVIFPLLNNPLEIEWPTGDGQITAPARR